MTTTPEQYEIEVGSTPIGDTGDYEGYVEVHGPKGVILSVSDPDDKAEEFLRDAVEAMNRRPSKPCAECERKDAVIEAARGVPDKLIWFEGKPAGCTVFPEKLHALILALKELDAALSPAAEKCEKHGDGLDPNCGTCEGPIMSAPDKEKPSCKCSAAPTVHDLFCPEKPAPESPAKEGDNV